MATWGRRAEGTSTVGTPAARWSEGLYLLSQGHAWGVGTVSQF